ncbi:hypothetical protein GOP47_0010382 [Adiantum capillus-veneris]|uniref:Band 7 domain-containing protein n=1 Tax=Adiantum capillus-veneris TaxID=13818 RepID=A0A9D4UUN5_ADICA|nr:hypothetical protein GOP47_0010382 [Adiantum capillus-veneris]
MSGLFESTELSKAQKSSVFCSRSSPLPCSTHSRQAELSRRSLCWPSHMLPASRFSTTATEDTSPCGVWQVSEIQAETERKKLAPSLESEDSSRNGVIFKEKFQSLRGLSLPSPWLRASRVAIAPISSPCQRTFVRGFQGGSYNEDTMRYAMPNPTNWGILIVPEKTAYVIERCGKYLKTLDSRIHILVPFVDRVAYVHSLKEKAIAIRDQRATTKDNVSILLDGILHIKEAINVEVSSLGLQCLHYKIGTRYYCPPLIETDRPWSCVSPTVKALPSRPRKKRDWRSMTDQEFEEAAKDFIKIGRPSTSVLPDDEAEDFCWRRGEWVGQSFKELGELYEPEEFEEMLRTLHIDGMTIVRG